jgi:signal transduction histidine kinase
MEGARLPPEGSGPEKRPPWPRWIDGELAVVAAGIALGSLALGGRHDFTAWRSALLGAAILPWIVETRVTFPRLPFAGWVIGWEAAYLFAGGDPFSLMLLVLLVGRISAVGSLWESLLVAAACIAVPVARSLTPGYSTLWAYWTVAVGIAYLAGRSLDYQRRLVAELRVAQAELARRAASEERQRIARELHDVIAHSLTVTMLHLTAARLALEADPREAADALAEAERLGRQSLADVRRAVGVLRAGGDRGEHGGTESPLPAAEDIPELVRRYREAGLGVELRMEGDPSALPAAAGLAAYRIVQESLNNVVRHAPGARADVEVRVGPSEAVIVVRDSGPPDVPSAGGHRDGGGLGVMGMRERAGLLGGVLRAGPDGAGWTVECRFPLQDQAVAEPGEPLPASGVPDPGSDPPRPSPNVVQTATP